MNAVNSVLFLLVWTFTVCRADDDICSVSCKNVTGTVGKEVNFTCSVSQKCSECCITRYKFLYPEIYNSSICREEFPEGSCDQRNNFTCRYTPTTEMMRNFKFFVNTQCGTKNTESTVNKADGCSVSYENVTLGKEANLTCSVSQRSSECCIKKYKFYYTEKHKDNDVICREDLPQGSCERRNSFTCKYTPTKAMTGQFRFFVQTIKCGPKNTEFTVDITEYSKLETATEDPGHGSTAPMFSGAAVGCFIIIIIIITMISVLCVKRFKRSNPSGLQREYERGASEEPTMTTVNDQNETK